MKRIVIILSMLIIITGVYAEESPWLLDLTMNLRVGYTPETDDIIMSTRIGIGADYTYLLKDDSGPGVQADFGMFPLAGMMKEPLMLFNFDLRAFWLEDFGSMELRPFVGYNFAFVGQEGNNQSNNMFCIGIELVVNQIGIEYTFVGVASPLIIDDYSDMGDTAVPGTGTTHRLGIIYRLRNR